MPELIIDVFKIIDINKHNTNGIEAVLRFGEQLVQGFFEMAAVGQFRQIVAFGQIFQAGIGITQLFGGRFNFNLQRLV